MSNQSLGLQIWSQTWFPRPFGGCNGLHQFLSFRKVPPFFMLSELHFLMLSELHFLNNLRQKMCHCIIASGQQGYFPSCSLARSENRTWLWQASPYICASMSARDSMGRVVVVEPFIHIHVHPSHNGTRITCYQAKRSGIRLPISLFRRCACAPPKHARIAKNASDATFEGNLIPLYEVCLYNRNLIWPTINHFNRGTLSLQWMFFAVELQVLPTFVVGEFVFMLLSLITLIHAVKQVMRIQRRSNKITIPAIPSYVRQAWNCLYLISQV